jgi:hypothetical protein
MDGRGYVAWSITIVAVGCFQPTSDGDSSIDTAPVLNQSERPAARAVSSTSDFSEVYRVALDTAPDALVGEVTDVVVRENDIIVADRMGDRLVTFDRTDGRLIRTYGREGDGPGEFNGPHTLVEASDGNIFIADASPRLTRLSPDLRLVDVYRMDVPTIVSGLTSVDGVLAVHQSPSAEARFTFQLWSPDTGVIDRFDITSELAAGVPYWPSIWRSHLAVVGGTLIAADNILYPLRRFTTGGVLVDTVGYVPPSWRQARQPIPGEFARFDVRTGRQEGVDEFLRSFTQIDGLYAIGGDFLLVTHRERVSDDYTRDVIRADAYRLGDGFLKVREDLELPGPVVEGGSCAWVLVEVPPAPWTLGCWVPRF